MHWSLHSVHIHQDDRLFPQIYVTFFSYLFLKNPGGWEGRAEATHPSPCPSCVGPGVLDSEGEVTLHMACGAVIPFSGVSYVRYLFALWFCSSKIWVRVRPAREARGHHKNKAFFYSCLLVCFLGDFPRVWLLWTRQRRGRHLSCLLTSLGAGVILKDMGHVITSYLGWFGYSSAQTETGRCINMVLSFPRGPRLRIWPLIFPGIHEARPLSMVTR